MIIKRQKQFVHPIVAKAITTTPGRSVMSGLIKVAKTGEKLKEGTNNLAWRLKLNPRETVKSGLKEGTAKVVENPDLVLANTVGTAGQYAALHAIDPTLAAASLAPGMPGFGTVYTAARAKIGTPASFKKAGDVVRNSKGFDKALDTVVGNQPKVTFRNSGPNARLKDRVSYNVRSGLADISNGIQNTGGAVVKLVKTYSKHDD
jgi:hypothetical protein